jgi:mRNA interferase MazF
MAVHGEDVIMIGIFSRVPLGSFHDTWVQIEERHPHFSQTGLKTTSLLKAEKIAIVHESVTHRRLGVLPSDMMTQVEKGAEESPSLTIKPCVTTSHQP